MIRPRISISPSARTSRAVVRSSTTALVDVVAVAARADVAARVERIAAQRAGQSPGGDDAARSIDERPSRVEGDPHAQQVGPVLVLVIIVVGIDALAVLVLGPRFDEDAVRAAVPAEGQGA